MGICLNMIVKNESRNLPRLFDSLSGWVDYYVISDTGSSDDTVEKIGLLGEKHQIPGIVVHHEWMNFAHNRNLALEAALAAKKEGLHHCSFVLIIDADEELVVQDTDWKKKLDPGTSYSTYKRIDGLAYRHWFLLNIENAQWTWHGAIHNYVKSDSPSTPRAHVHGVWIRYHNFEGAKSHGFADSREKAIADRKKMEDELHGLVIHRDNVLRFFQFAYLQQQLGDWVDASRLYNRIAGTADAPLHMRYMAGIFAGKLLYQLGQEKEARVALERAHTTVPERKEYFYYTALSLAAAGNTEEAISMLEASRQNPSVNLDYWVMEPAVYDWKIEWELCLLYRRQGRWHDLLHTARKLMGEQLLPDVERKFLVQLIRKTEEDMQSGKPADPHDGNTGQ